MGSAAIQGSLWGARARDWAQLMEQNTLPLAGAVLDAARVTAGSRMLDAGSGTGIAALLGALRGAEVSAIDASAASLKIARERIPDAHIQEADLEDLPFDDDTFDAVIAINSVFYAENPATAMNELARVARRGGIVVVTSWGREDQCEYAAVIRGMASLMPPPPPGAPAGGPFALSEPGALEATVTQAGLRAFERDEVPCPFVFPSVATAVRASGSAGVAQRVIAHAGEDAVQAAVEGASRRFERPDGSVRFNNVFNYVAGVHP